MESGHASARDREFRLQHERRGPSRFAASLSALVLGAVAMGASPIFVRLADVGPYSSAFWRTFLALPFLWLWARFETRAKRERLRIGVPVVLAGLFFAGDLFFWHLAIMNTRVANATFFATMTPVWVAIGAWLLASESLSLRTLAGMALCFLGGFALIGDSFSFAPQRILGDAFGLITSFFFGAYILAMRAGRANQGPAELAFLSTAISSACLLLIAIAFEPTIWPRTLDGVAILLGLALISQVGGQGLLAVALGALPATFSSLVIFIEAIAAAGFGWILLSESLGALQALGGALILLGIAVARPRNGGAP